MKNLLFVKIIILFFTSLTVIAAPTWKKINISSGSGSGGNLVSCTASYVPVGTSSERSFEVVLPEDITLYYILKNDRTQSSNDNYARINALSSGNGGISGDYRELRGTLTITAGNSLIVRARDRFGNLDPSVTFSYQSSGGCFLTGVPW